MTLILIAWDEKHFFAVGDAHISAPKARRRSAVGNPLQIDHDAKAATSLHHLRRKSVIYGNDLFLWSGSMLQARSAISHCLVAHDLPFSELSQRFSEARSEMKDTSLLVVRNDGGKFQILEHDCLYGEGGDSKFKVVFSGTGAADLLWDVLGEATEGIDFSSFKLGNYIFAMVAKLFIIEQVDPNHEGKFYGGMYEIIIPCARGGFRFLDFRIDQFRIGDGDFLEYVGSVISCHSGASQYATTIRLNGIYFKPGFGYVSNHPGVSCMKINDVFGGAATKVLKGQVPAPSSPIVIRVCMEKDAMSIHMADGFDVSIQLTSLDSFQVDVSEEFLAWSKSTNQKLKCMRAAQVLSARSAN